MYTVGLDHKKGSTPQRFSTSNTAILLLWYIDAPQHILRKQKKNKKKGQ